MNYERLCSAAVLIVVCWANSRPMTESPGPANYEQAAKPLDCNDLNGYSLEEGTEPDTHSVKIVRDGTVLHTIKLLSDRELNGFGFNGAKKTKDGFEISIEYGTRIYYGKTFVFVCRQRKFYLSKIRVDSFNRRNPAKWKRRMIRVRPNLPLEKFSINDFTLPVHTQPSKESRQSPIT